jgi:hypothetical protein
MRDAAFGRVLSSIFAACAAQSDNVEDVIKKLRGELSTT